MAVKYLNNQLYHLVKDVDNIITYQVGTDEAQVILASKNAATFGAVDVATAATKITGADSAVTYKLNIDADDLDFNGMIVFESKGATDTTYVYCQIHDALAGNIKAGGIAAATFANDAIAAAAIADDAIVAANIATGAITADAFASGAIAADAIATDALGALELAAGAASEIASAIQSDAIPCYMVQKGEVTAAKRTFPIEVIAAESQTITVSKAGGSFGACASGTAASAITGTQYKLVLAQAELNTLGMMRVLSTGASGVRYIDFMVVDFDPFTEGAATQQAIKYRGA